MTGQPSRSSEITYGSPSAAGHGGLLRRTYAAATPAVAPTAASTATTTSTWRRRHRVIRSLRCCPSSAATLSAGTLIPAPPTTDADVLGAPAEPATQNSR